MKLAVVVLCAALLSGCSRWDTLTGDGRMETANVGGERRNVVYISAGPGVYDMRALKFRLTEGVAAENRAYTEEATGQVARRLCGGNAEMVSIERIDNNALYEARWRCR